jgi:hypothetical protein
VAFKTTHTIKHHIKVRDKRPDVYNLSGVYQMTCKDCPVKYLYVVGQAGLTFRTRYNEHNREIQANGKTSKYAPTYT